MSELERISWRRVALHLVAAGALALAYPAAGALILPGLGLELWLVPESPGPLARGARAFLLSLAFWPLAVFLTRVTPIDLGGIAWGGIGLGVLLIAFAGPRRSSSGGESGSWLLLAAFGIFTVLHLLPMREWIVAPGADMSMHTFMARLIAEAGRLPDGYEPLYPIHDFGAYAAGLPAIAAVLSRLSGAAVHRASLAVALLCYPALATALYLVARRFAGDAFALAAAFLVTACCQAYGYLGWGGNPTVLSLALALAAVAPLAGSSHGSFRSDGALLLPLLIAGAGLVHAIPVLALAYAMTPAALVWILAAPRAERSKLLLAWTGLAVAGGLLLGLPYLGSHPEVSAAERAWAASWQREYPHSFQGNLADFGLTIWPYLWHRLGADAFAIGVIGVGAAWARKDRRLLPWVLFGAAVCLLILNSRYWVLPGSPALYPERAASLLLAPLAAGLAAALPGLTGWWRGARPMAARVALALLATVALSRAAYCIHRHFVGAGRSVMVTADDLKAIRWIEEKLPKDAVIANNYGDAGLWIPALALRAVVHPHSNPFYFDELAAWAKEAKPGYVFVGAKKTYGDIAFTAAEIRGAPEHYAELHVEGGATLFELGPRGAGASSAGR